MKIFKRLFILTLIAVMLINVCGCGSNKQKYTTKTVKEEVLVPSTRTETRVVGQRIVGVNKILREDGSYSDDTDYSDEENNTDEEDVSSDDTTSDEEVIRPLTDNLIEDNIFAYRVVRSNESTGIVTKAVGQIVKDIKEKLNCTVTYKTDSVKELGWGLFDGCEATVTVYCDEGSAAYDYCKRNGIKEERITERNFD